jgi:hypothetical protein
MIKTCQNILLPNNDTMNHPSFPSFKWHVLRRVHDDHRAGRLVIAAILVFWQRLKRNLLQNRAI